MDEERSKALSNIAKTIRDGTLRPRRKELFEQLWASRIETEKDLGEGSKEIKISIPNAATLELIVGKNHVYALSLVVEKHLRQGLGMGTELMQRIEDLARREGKHYLYFSATPIRPEGGVHPYHFYRRLGYELHPREDPRRVEEKIRKGQSIDMVRYLTPLGKSILKKELKNQPRKPIRIRL